MGEQDVVHLPELALRGGRFGCLGGELSARVDVVERQVPPYVSDVVAVGGQQLADRAFGLAAVRAFEVPVLDQCHRGVVRAADVVVLGIDVGREVEDVLGRAGDLARAKRFGQLPDQAGQDPSHRRRHHHRAERAELRLVELDALEGEARDEQRNREADARRTRRR